MSTVTVNVSHSTINVGSNASYVINGGDDTILVGSNSLVTANGSALSVTVSGPGSVVTIGGNGVAASNASDNFVTFNNVAGAVHELANSRVEVIANNTTATMAGNDALGVYGSGDTVTATGLGNSVWIGLNGFGVTGRAIDFVSGLDHGSVYELQGSSVSTDGAYYHVALAAQDTLTASGRGVHVNANGAGDVVTLGGNGAARLQSRRGCRGVPGRRRGQPVRRQPRRCDGVQRHGDLGRPRHVRPLWRRRDRHGRGNRRRFVDRPERLRRHRQGDRFRHGPQP